MIRYDLLDSLGKIVYHQEGPHTREMGGGWNPHAPHGTAAPPTAGGSGPNTNVTNPNPDFGTPKDASANAKISAVAPNTGQGDPVRAADFSGSWTGPEGNIFAFAPGPGPQGGPAQFLTKRGQETWEKVQKQEFQGTTGGQPYTSTAYETQPDATPTGVPPATTGVTPTGTRGNIYKTWGGDEVAQYGAKPGEGVYGGTFRGDAESVVIMGDSGRLPSEHMRKLDTIKNWDYENDTIDNLAQELERNVGRSMRTGFLAEHAVGGKGMTREMAKDVAAQAYSEANPAGASEYYKSQGLTSPQDLVDEPQTADESEAAINTFHESMMGLVGRRNFEDFVGDPTARQNLAYTVRQSFALPKGWSFTTKENGEVQLTPPTTDKESAVYIANAATLTSQQQQKLASALQMQQDARQMHNRVEAQMVGAAGRKGETDFLTGERTGAEAHATQTAQAQQAHELSMQKEQARVQIERMGFDQTLEQNKLSLTRDLETARINEQGASRESQTNLMNLQRELDAERYKAEIGSAEGMQTAGFEHQTELQNSIHDQKMDMIDHQHGLARGIAYEEEIWQRKREERKNEIDRGMQELIDKGAMDRLTDQIEAEADRQGKQIDHEEAMQRAESELREALQKTQLEHEVDQLTEQGKQALDVITETGKEERLTLAEEITSRELLHGNQITSTEAEALAERELREKLHKEEIRTGEEQQVTAGEQAISQIEATGAQERETLELGETIAKRQRDELGITTAAEALTNAQTATTGYVQGLSSALTTAIQSGDYSAVETQLAQALPPAPSGIVWDEASGVFQQRGGFEGREIDAATQQWIATVTPAFKARGRAEQATSQATRIQQEQMARQVEKQQAEDDFRQNMLTGDIDSAEEANTRRVMAETAAIATEQKMEHVKMLMSLIQNPVQLGMAKRHGLLGQIESVLGFTMSNVPDSSGVSGGVPTMNEWQTMDSEAQAFNLATYVEQGGSPDEFLRMIAGSVPAQMQQVQYGVL